MKLVERADGLMRYAETLFRDLDHAHLAVNMVKVGVSITMSPTSTGR
jgi:hypothetical protein